MTWLETDFEIEMKLEAQQVEKELQQMIAEYNLPDWDSLDDL